MLKKTGWVLFAGTLGGLTNSIGIWLFGKIGINQFLGFQMEPDLTLQWLIPRLISSCLWGLLFLLPFWNHQLYKKAFLLSFAPLFMMLFLVFPKMNAGIMGFKLGISAPIFAFVFTEIWGMTAAFILDKAQVK